MKLFITVFFVVFLFSINSFSQQTSIVIKKEEGQPQYIKLEEFEEKETKFVDEGGAIYIERGYRGVVPGVRNEPDIPFKKGKKERKTLKWVGFQPFRLYSRVFILATGNPSFIVQREEAKKISVLVEDTIIPSQNDKREIITRNFPSSVDKIEIKEVIYKKGKQDILVNIFLKKSVGYLYRQEGDYIFVDVEY